MIDYRMISWPQIAFVGLLTMGFFLAAGCSDDPGSTDDSEDTGVEFDIGDSSDAESPEQNTTNGAEDAGADEDDVGPTADAETGPDENDDNGATDGLYVGTGDPYEPGELSVTGREVDDGPAELEGLLVITPDEPGEYPVAVYQHGFLMANTHYQDLLEHVASHGFVVVAPQMYEAGSLMGAPSTEEEAQLASELYDWIATDLDDQVDVDARVDRLGIAGHSRGAKVSWWSLGEDPRPLDALAGVDPVDGTGGPLDNEPRVLDDPVDIDAPVLLIGTGLGSESPSGFEPECAPEGDNYEAFFAASSAPAWQVLAPEYGHLDMLDDDPEGCGFECTACVDGESRQPMRTLTAGLLVALFRGGLQGDDSSFDALSDESAAPVNVEIESKP